MYDYSTIDHSILVNILVVCFVIFDSVNLYSAKRSASSSWVYHINLIKCQISWQSQPFCCRVLGAAKDSGRVGGSAAEVVVVVGHFLLGGHICRETEVHTDNTVQYSTVQYHRYRCMCKQYLWHLLDSYLSFSVHMAALIFGCLSWGWHQDKACTWYMSTLHHM